ncbi:hypothetical protein PGAL8A_API03700 (apicoplast) [Plasmodium gallinaceum]|uniref:Uncharacterized protein n=1 Tax=Plasmodium gallinaceum TaxID=5849 RepID=A0A1J1H439_PLAGA|nr:hypothetical protein PGAL8A_API03700 [Plasmodium gallinaceum]CRG98247.1 hypothetical protein PGAL8A_API03700 [Plasmodium gallinaceum]
MINNIFLYSKSNKTKYKTYKIILIENYKIIKLGIYNPKLNIISCMYYKLLKYLKYNYILNKNLLKILLYKIKNNIREMTEWFIVFDLRSKKYLNISWVQIPFSLFNIKYYLIKNDI